MKALPETLLLVSALLTWAPPLSAASLFRDDFNGSVDPAWSVVRDDPSYVTVTGSTLDIRANSGVLAFSPNTAKNVFLIDNPATGDFAITVRIESYTGSNQQYDQFDILAYDDDDNHVRCDYTYISGRRCLEFGKEEAGNWGADSVEMDFGSTSFYLRLSKTGNVYRQSYSTNGLDFIEVNSPITYGDGSPAKLGFVLSDDPAETSVARIDSFEVTGAAPPATVRINGPRRLVTKAGKVTLRGTSTDAVRVEVKSGRGPFKSAKGVTTWTHRARIAEGSNKIIARAINGDGLPSSPAKVIVLRRR